MEGGEGTRTRELTIWEEELRVLTNNLTHSLPEVDRVALSLVRDEREFVEKIIELDRKYGVMSDLAYSVLSAISEVFPIELPREQGGQHKLLNDILENYEMYLKRGVSFRDIVIGLRGGSNLDELIKLLESDPSCHDVLAAMICRATSGVNNNSSDERITIAERLHLVAESYISVHSGDNRIETDPKVIYFLKTVDEFLNMQRYPRFTDCPTRAIPERSYGVSNGLAGEIKSLLTNHRNEFGEFLPKIGNATARLKKYEGTSHGF